MELGKLKMLVMLTLSYNELTGEEFVTERMSPKGTELPGWDWSVRIPAGGKSHFSTIWPFIDTCFQRTAQRRTLGSRITPYPGHDDLASGKFITTDGVHGGCIL